MRIFAGALIAMTAFTASAILSPALGAPPSLPPGNPFATPSTLPFGAPAFDKIKDSDYRPAIEAGMAAELADYRAIADNAAPPSFDNTIVASEQAGRLLTRANLVFQNIIASDTNDVLDKVNAVEAPKLQAHSDAILLDPKLFARVKTLYDARDSLGLDADQSFLLQRVYTRFVRAGALLSPADKGKLKSLNGRIASLSAAYLVKLRGATNEGAVIVTDRAELDGLTDAEIKTAADAATARKLPGKYLITLVNTTQQPVLAELTNRPLRQRILAASEARSDHAGVTDQRERIAALAVLRAQKAQLLGYPSYAAFVLDDQMAKTPDAARKLLADLVPAAVAKAKAEAAELQALIDAQKGGFTLTAADWAFYAAQIRKQKYAIDDAEVRQYFVLDRVVTDGLFFEANKLYGLTFRRRTDLPVYDPDVKVYEVSDADGSPLALFYTDYFARPNKNGGAWCQTLNQPSGLTGQKPIIVNDLNITKPSPGEPVLLTADEVTTLFHEFGHALHAMISVRKYPSEYGFSLPTDVIEFPSQFNEHWAFDPTVLASYAHHYKTGDAIPADLVEKIKRAKNYGQGYAATELLASALLDLDWHTLPGKTPKPRVESFEAESLAKNNIALAEVPPRYHSPYFLHIWANGYESNYYSYLWGEILDDDAYEWFTEHGGLTRENGQRFRDLMLGPGFTDNPMTLYRNFRGRDPSVEALKRQRGLE